jgi:hypothetical protein
LQFVGRAPHAVGTTVGSTAALILLLIGVGCRGSGPCPLACSEVGPASFVLMCNPTDLTSVTASGLCALPDASPLVAVSELTIYGRSPGVCHVVLTFASGFTYTADVNFVSQTDPEPPGCVGTCPPYITATQRTFVVDNPPETCTDGGTDATTED